MVVKLYIVIFYVKTISSLIHGCQCFGGTYYHLQTVLKMEVAGSSETLVNCLLEHMVSYKVCLKSNENGAIKFFIKN